MNWPRWSAYGIGWTFHRHANRVWPRCFGLWASTGTTAATSGSIRAASLTRSARIHPTRAPSIVASFPPMSSPLERNCAMNATSILPGLESLVKPFKFPACPYEYKVTPLRECPLPENLQPCETPDKAADYWRLHIASHPHFNPDCECLAVLLLNTRRRVKGHQLVSIGTMDTILVHPREIFRLAIVTAASAVIALHNLCAAAHKLCYVKRRVMCSGIAVASSRRRRMRCIESPGLHIIKAPITRQGGRGVSATSDRACLGLGSVSPPTEAFCVSSPGQSRHRCWSSRWRRGPARNGSC